MFLKALLFKLWLYFVAGSALIIQSELILVYFNTETKVICIKLFLQLYILRHWDLRYHRIINNPTCLNNRLQELSSCFLQSGYPKKMVQNVIDVKKRPRPLNYREKTNIPPFPVLWVQTYGPTTSFIQNLQWIL